MCECRPRFCINATKSHDCIILNQVMLYISLETDNKSLNCENIMDFEAHVQIYSREYGEDFSSTIIHNGDHIVKPNRNNLLF